MDILWDLPVRKSRKQKEAFRREVTAYLQRLGYSCRVEKGSFGAKNLVFGDSEKAPYLVTAHYDTCARLPFPNMAFPCSMEMTLLYQLAITLGMLAVSALAAGLAGFFLGKTVGQFLFPFFLLAICGLVIAGPANPNCVNDNSSGVITVLEIARSIPASQRSQVCFVLFDLEEAGLIGSECYRKAHRTAAQRQLVLNLDCVGDGDHIIFLPSRQVRKEPETMQKLRSCGGWYGSKRIFVRRKGFSFYPSDQYNFPRAVGICALRRKGKLLYLSHIHTAKDTILEITNVNLLQAAIVSMITVRQ